MGAKSYEAHGCVWSKHYKNINYIIYLCAICFDDLKTYYHHNVYYN